MRQAEQTADAKQMPGDAGARPFRIAVRQCRRCGREWPAHLALCTACAAALGDARELRCARLVPPLPSQDIPPALVVAVAVELCCRHQVGAEWAAAVWRELAPAFDGALRIRPGPAGSIVSAWALDGGETLGDVATLALGLTGQVAAVDRGIEVRGGIALGVIGGAPGGDAVERVAERLALAASPGRWLVVGEVARRLQSGFEFSGVGIVPRWPLTLPLGVRALVAPLVVPLLPSAVTGDPPSLVLGRVAERSRLLIELASAAAGGRRVVLVTAPAGGGKSHLLRRVLADGEPEIAAGVAFPPLGGRVLEPVRALLAELDPTIVAADTPERVGAQLGAAVSARARQRPTAVVVDDVHWADPDSLAALQSAIAESDPAAQLVWVVSARTAALPRLVKLAALADVVVRLPPLEPVHRVELLEGRLGTIPDALRDHVTTGPQRGNPLYLEHLAAMLADEHVPGSLPQSLHEAVLGRLNDLGQRARELARWSQSSPTPQRDLETLERELGDWLDRLETSDLAELTTIGRYLARLRWIDVELVIARSLLGMSVASNRRLAQAIERLAAASTSALLDYLATVAREDPRQAAHEASAAAQRAELALRLADAEQLLAFACEHDPDQPELLRRRGDLALVLGWPGEALAAYRAVAPQADGPVELERRIARAEASAGRAHAAIRRLDRAAHRLDVHPDMAYAVALDLARLRGTQAPEVDGVSPAPVRRRAARVAAWADAPDADRARRAAGLLSLDGQPAACAVELIETAALAGLAGVQVGGLQRAARQAAMALGNPSAVALLETPDVDQARRLFLHWDT
jgi:tetratricopeptide (TPR) repeat protein